MWFQLLLNLVFISSMVSCWPSGAWLEGISAWRGCCGLDLECSYLQTWLIWKTKPLTFTFIYFCLSLSLKLYTNSCVSIREQIPSETKEWQHLTGSRRTIVTWGNSIIWQNDRSKSVIDCPTVSLSMSSTFIPGPLLSIIFEMYCFTASVTFMMASLTHNNRENESTRKKKNSSSLQESVSLRLRDFLGCYEEDWAVVTTLKVFSWFGDVITSCVV